MFKTFEEYLNEATIGKVQKNVKIKVEIDSTVHSEIRKGRHGDRKITDSEIVQTADRAIPDITEELIFDKIDIGAVIHIKNTKNDLNLIAEIKGKGENMILKIVTVMIKKDFIPKKGTKSFTI